MHWAGSDGDCGTPKPKRILTAVDRDAILQMLPGHVLSIALTVQWAPYILRIHGGPS
ncbi:hypothetical protein NITMOv2_1062 [Nitrospira moscoviensis]|uniref:Uncharacterized protein n=1 Tax=Nitrospira moscoviensis TaxID=42253 RepID=A0A0K2G965_NITMO|nr:hypothetical protein NITMOv2_1062 [Nitrospira moscoviensis]